MVHIITVAVNRLLIYYLLFHVVIYKLMKVVHLAFSEKYLLVLFFLRLENIIYVVSSDLRVHYPSCGTFL